MRISPRAQAIQPTLIREITSRARPSSLHLGLGQPDLPLSVTARAVLASARHAPYTANKGLDELVELIAERYEPAPGVIVTVGVQEALAVALLGLVDGGDVLVPTPGFPAYPNLVRLAGGNPVPYELGERWSLDPAAVERAWTEETAAVVLNTPSNPTGAVATPAALEHVVECCRARGAFYISDEIYEDFVWEGEHVTPWSFGDCGVVVSGLSKSHAAMGLRLGWLVGPPEVTAGLVPLHQHLVTCAPTLSQRVAIELLSDHERHVSDVRDIFVRRRDIALRGIVDAGLPMPVADGAFYLFVDVRDHVAPEASDVELALAILDEVDVVTIPGSGFGAAGAGWLRLAYTVDEAILTDALTRLKQFFHTRSTG